MNEKFRALLVSAAIASGATTTVLAADHHKPVEIGFVFHLDAGMPEQDVFVSSNDDPTKVHRVSKDNWAPEDQLFSSKDGIHHDPFGGGIGPFNKGQALGFTAMDWFAASGNAVYTCNQGRGDLEAEFSGLVPGGIYTMWHFFMPSPATEPFVGTLDLPYGERDGSTSSFMADDYGNAIYTQSNSPCLQMSGEQLMAGLAIAYHSDGKTHGVYAGEFGRNAHVQLFAPLPANAKE